MEKSKSTYMTWEQLKEKYPNTWILLFNPNLPMTGYEVFGGEFVYKNKNRDRVWQKANEIGSGQKITVRYTGEIINKENTAILL